MAPAPAPVVDLLPDIIIWEEVLYDYVIGTTMSSEPPAGRPCIRMSTATVNIGDGRLELRGGAIQGNAQTVLQRVFRSDNTFWDREAGQFVYHATHSHIHFDDWTIFRLRSVLPGGGIGPIVREGAKTSFCILELRTYDGTMPGYNTAPGYSSCGQVQGLRPGRADIYDYGLTDQYIDITGLANGQYWLEGTVDPENKVLEKNETNNTSRILVNVGPNPTAVPDAYEENDSVAQVNALPVGAPNSANLGTLSGIKVINNLSIEDANDFFKFTLSSTGTLGDYISIGSPYAGANINLRLLNSSGTVLASSTSSTSYDYISLSGRAPGTYFVRVDKVTVNNPQYTLKIEPAGNQPPFITITSPTTDLWIEKALETIPATWLCNDPEGQPKTVSLYSAPFIGSPDTEALLSYQNMPGTNEFANVNTANMPVGPLHLLFRCSDGGAVTDRWTQRPVYVYRMFDLNWDDVVNHMDWHVLNLKYPMSSFTDYSFLNRYKFRRLLDHDKNGRITWEDIDEFYEHTHDH